MISDYRQECEDLAAAFQWTAKINMHEAVANHFSLAVGDGTSFLINPNQKHFSLITASDILLLKTDEDPLNYKMPQIQLLGVCIALFINSYPMQNVYTCSFYLFNCACFFKR